MNEHELDKLYASHKSAKIRLFAGVAAVGVGFLTAMTAFAALPNSDSNVEILGVVMLLLTVVLHGIGLPLLISGIISAKRASSRINHYKKLNNTSQQVLNQQYTNPAVQQPVVTPQPTQNSQPAPIASFCTKCGARTGPDDVFCAFCGNKVK